MDDIIYFINDSLVTEAHFWNAVQGMIKPDQISRLIRGERIVLGGISYQIRKR